MENAEQFPRAKNAQKQEEQNHRKAFFQVISKKKLLNQYSFFPTEYQFFNTLIASRANNSACFILHNQISLAFNAFLSDRAATIEESRVSKRDGQLLMELTIRLVNPIMHEDAMQLLDTYPDIYDISIGKL